ncbi:MAG TPA: RNA polymerase factor sigma-54 [Gemmatimonadales bacterium]|jgi:RNA polymerase sigma-54 factor|nr:RNA polymerase factor sigma-54 [Gemmatimonadales bacterium]
MKTGLHQQTGLRQELRINPRLYQAMDMLYMPMLDLQQHLQQELLNNPFLELEEPEDEAVPEKTTAEEQEEVKKDDEVDWEEILINGFEVGGQREQYESLQYVEPVSVESRDLSDHLRDQLQMLVLEPRQRLLCEEIIGNVTDEGRLGATAEEILASANQWLLSNNPAARQPEPEERDPFDLDDDEEAEPQHTNGHTAPLPPGVMIFTTVEFDAALGVVQSLDPPGIAARDLRECLLLQLQDVGDTESLTYRFVDQAFADLTAHRWNDLARKFGVEPREAQTAVDLLSRLDPKPGLKYSERNEAYIIPDLIVEKIEGRYQVFLNDTTVPRLRLSRSYQEIARDRAKMTTENRDFIASRMNSATWMIQAIEQRRQTMLKVMNFIVDRQRDFFEKGIEYLRPLTLREVAEVISMHESTVSRVTNEKFVQTPRGVLPLKFFFSSALSTASGEDASARSIRAKLEKMVAEETPAKPLTDQQIVHLFEEQGIQIARRTVAKYRDQLGILPARMRKRV